MTATTRRKTCAKALGHLEKLKPETLKWYFAFQNPRLILGVIQAPPTSRSRNSAEPLALQDQWHPGCFPERNGVLSVRMASRPATVRLGEMTTTPFTSRRATGAPQGHSTFLLVSCVKNQVICERADRADHLLCWIWRACAFVHVGSHHRTGPGSEADGRLCGVHLWICGLRGLRPLASGFIRRRRLLQPIQWHAQSLIFSATDPIQIPSIDSSPLW